MVVVASLLTACQPGLDDPGEILRAGACDRMRILHQTAQTFGGSPPVAAEYRDDAIEQQLQAVKEQAAPGPELTRSEYGRDLTAFQERVELAVLSENARDHDDPGGPDWEAIADEGATYAESWGCDQTWTLG